MKKSLPLFAAAWLFALQMQAQITLHASDFSFNGSAVVAIDTLANVQPGGTGEQVWNFTALQTHFSEMRVFSSADSVPYQDYFPQANSASVWSTANSIYSRFFQLDDQSLSYLGRHRTVGDSVVVVNTHIEPGLSMVRFPAGFGDSYEQDVKSTRTACLCSSQPDSFLFIQHIHHSVSLDAWGILNTPAGSFEVLRFKDVNTSIDSSFDFSLATGTWVYSGPSIANTSTVTSYSFWTNQNGLPVPMLEIATDSDGKKTAAWVKNFTTKTGEAAMPEVRLFPNPASDWLTVEAPEQFEGRLEIWDLHGRLAVSKQVAGVSELLDVSAFPTGAYVAVLKDGQGRLAGFRRFEVAR